MLNVIGVEVVFQLIATFTLFMLIGKYLYPTYKNYIKERKDSMNQAISNTLKNEEDSKVIINDLKNEKEDIIFKKQHILATATNDANLKKEEIINDSKEKARKIIQKANDEIQLDKKNAEKEISEDVAQYASLIAKKFISSNITDEDMDKFINETISEVHIES